VQHICEYLHHLLLAHVLIGRKHAMQIPETR